MAVTLSEIEFRALNLDPKRRSREEIDAEVAAVEEITDRHLSEPYSGFVYRFFLNNWPELCLLALHEDKIIGCIMSKVEPHKERRVRGYIGMLSVEDEYRGLGIAKELISRTLDKMVDLQCDEIILETEAVNKGALKLYENFGFQRVKRLFRYYMNKHDAYRLILPITEKSYMRSVFLAPLPEELNKATKY